MPKLTAKIGADESGRPTTIEMKGSKIKLNYDANDRLYSIDFSGKQPSISDILGVVFGASPKTIDTHIQMPAGFLNIRMSNRERLAERGATTVTNSSWWHMDDPDYDLLKVPVGELWRVQAIHAYLVTGTFTFNSIGLNSKVKVGAGIFAFDSFASATDRVFVPSCDFFMWSGDFIAVFVDGFTKAGGLACVLYGEKWKAS
jgi:hypothetical protein